MKLRLTFGVLLILIFAVSVSAIEIPPIGASGPVGQPITGVGITGGEGEIVSCIQNCIVSCTQGCTTTSCAEACGRNCADKCLSGAGITTDTKSRGTTNTDAATYCAAATTCDQCRNRPAYRCVWAGGCVPCTGPSCIISCGYVAKKPKITVDESGDTGKKEDATEEGFIVNRKTGEKIDIRGLNETEIDRIKRPNYYKYSNSTISKIFRGIESFFSWIFS